MKSLYRIAGLWLGAALLPLCASCATWYDLRYDPAPLEVRIADSATAELAGRALVSVLGVRRPTNGQAAQFELALRLENLGGVPFTIDPASLELVSADLKPLGSARVSPEPLPMVGVGETQTFELAFPLPAGSKLGDYDVEGLNLRWTLRFLERELTTGVTFKRRAALPAGYYYDDPFFRSHWHGYMRFGLGHFHAY